MVALGEILGMPARQHFRSRWDWRRSRPWRNQYPANDFPVLASLHSDVADFRGRSAERMFTLHHFPSGVYKQHFPPTDSNVRLASSFDNVVLTTREPSEVVASHLRVAKDSEARLRLRNSPTLQTALKTEVAALIEGWRSQPITEVIEFSF